MQVLEARVELSLLCFYSDCKVSERCRVRAIQGSGYHIVMGPSIISEIASRWPIATGSSSQQLHVFAVGRGNSDIWGFPKIGDPNIVP